MWVSEGQTRSMRSCGEGVVRCVDDPVRVERGVGSLERFGSHRGCVERLAVPAIGMLFVSDGESVGLGSVVAKASVCEYALLC